MNKTILLLAAVTLVTASCSQTEQSPKAMNQVDFSQVRIQDEFWSPRLQNNARNTLPVCIDQIENQTGRMRNFEKAAIPEGPHSGIFFDDSDVYKAVEGMAYSLINNPDPELEAKADEWIDKFEAAQQPDGYINTYFTIQEPERRWTNMDMHEMYCAGHLLEAGIAYYKATGKRKLLDIGQKMADYMMSVFGPGKRDWVPGHEEIELALVKLYELTGEKKYLDFAYWLLEERGHNLGTLDVNEGIARQWECQHFQDIVPVRDLAEISGHAVRAMYLFCGMCDVTSYMPETGYMEALDRLWDDVIGTRMYVTGGIGVNYRCEGFAAPFELPNREAYCETCASIGMCLWNHRMNEWKGDGKYADIVERSLFNGVLAGINTEGDRFFYVNPLASDGDHHRQAWYGCACCPSNVCRFIPSIGSYIYGTSADAIWVNLYVSSEAAFEAGGKPVDVRMETGYPWEGGAALTLLSAYKGKVKLRVPGWCKSFSVSVNGKTLADCPVELGYAVVERKWKKGDVVAINMDMPVELVAADPRVKADEGLRAVQRGPIVYCAEQLDNPANFADITLCDGMQWNLVDSPLMGGIRCLESACCGSGSACCGSSEGTACGGSGSACGAGAIRLIPYYSWDNREPCEMKVWMDFAE